jgi:hypothetical protein
MTVFIIWLVCAIVSGMVGSGKGRTGAGWTLGILLGPIGLIIIFVMPGNVEKAESKAIESGDMRKCPFCAELVKREAIVCKHCGRDLPANIPSPGQWECAKCGSKNETKFERCQSCAAEKPV